jgi:hypothetical protein
MDQALMAVTAARVQQTLYLGLQLLMLVVAAGHVWQVVQQDLEDLELEVLEDLEHRVAQHQTQTRAVVVAGVKEQQRVSEARGRPGL